MKAVLLAPLIVLPLACGPAIARNVSDGLPAGTYVITASDIAGHGAHTAWQVLKQDAPMLLTQEDENGRPSKLIRRGRTSLLFDDPPVIVLDNVRMPDFRNLDTVEAESIDAIYIFDGLEGTTMYGTNSGSGVILIKTKDGRSSSL
ncbi:MAG TPA: TonB-dependent receptor plug domain-containing protein [Gemmatimonadales bacterium]|nr:TonB-dependent receptor plug domain-containing protein [Gemmatimonadales bacterium]